MKKNWLERTERGLLNLDYKPFTLNVKGTSEGNILWAKN